MIPQYALYLAGGGMATVSTQSTGVPLSTTDTPCQVVHVWAVSTNTAAIFIADSTVKYATTGRVGIPIWPGSTSQLREIPCRNLTQVYIDGISTEAVSFVYYSMQIGVS